MTKNPACATPDSTLQEVAHMMEMYDCGCIPIVENHKNNMPVGTITDRDIAIRALAADKNPTELKASDIMTTDIATITPETSVERCRDTMEERRFAVFSSSIKTADASASSLKPMSCRTKRIRSRPSNFSAIFPNRRIRSITDRLTVKIGLNKATHTIRNTAELPLKEKAIEILPIKIEATSRISRTAKTDSINRLSNKRKNSKIPQKRKIVFQSRLFDAVFNRRRRGRGIEIFSSR
jgi:CBS domain-containing protein